MASTRVRFAPSPTGFLHVGGARTALYNWIIAHQTGGTFILRIEDTDAERNREEWVDGIYDALGWLGIGPDRGVNYEVYRQSAFVDDHRAAAARLFGAGDAYYCDCARDAVDARNKEAGRASGYDGFCLDRGLGPAERSVLRFRVPRPGSTIVVDLIRGTPTFDHETLDDFVLLRGDGSPMFLLANVVDDITMGVNLVVRAEEHLPNTPKQQLLWSALGAEPPTWAHVPLLVNEKRQKLSKRRDPVALESYRDEGYLPEAVCNYLMLLGWSPPGDVEIVPWSVIDEHFSLAAVNSSPAFFDVKKLRAFNAEYLRALSTDEFIAAWHAWVADHPQAWEYNESAFAAVAPYVQVRTERLCDIPAQVEFLFGHIEPTDEDWAKGMADPGGSILDAAIAAFGSSSWTADALKGELEAIAAAHGLKLGKAQAPVRLAATGRLVGLPLFESCEALGRDVTLGRLRAARARR